MDNKVLTLNSFWKCIVKYQFILIVIIIIFVIFYWFVWRPRQIIAKCSQEAREWINEQDVKKNIKTVSDLERLYDIKYKLCTREKGL